MGINSALASNGDSLVRLRRTFENWRVPVSVLEELTERNIAVTFAKDAMVFSEGSTPDLLGCVLSGYVRVYCAVGDGNRTLMRIAGPGELLGYSDFLDQKGRRARLFEAQCLTKCNISLISRDHIARSLRTLDPDTLVDLFESLNTFWSLTTRWFAVLLGLPFQQRIEMVFSDLAQRMGVSDARGVMLLPEICHEELAEMIGCSRPMVTRLVHEMEESGKLLRRGKQYVLLGDWDFGADIYEVGRTRSAARSANGAYGRSLRTAPVPTSSPSVHQQPLFMKSAAK
jgi:CRP/FNR family transcriptional regulator, cyclic AMP receptor protein